MENISTTSTVETRNKIIVITIPTNYESTCVSNITINESSNDPPEENSRRSTDTSSTTCTEDGKAETIVVEALIHPPKNISTSDDEMQEMNSYTDQDAIQVFGSDILNVAFIASHNSVANTDHSTVKRPETTQIVYENVQERPRDQDNVQKSKNPSPSFTEKILNWRETNFMTGSDSSSFDLDDPYFQSLTVRQKLNKTLIRRSSETCNSDDTDIIEDERESTIISEGESMDITVENKCAPHSDTERKQHDNPEEQGDFRLMVLSSSTSYTEFVQDVEGRDKNLVAPQSHSDGTSRDNKPDEDTDRKQHDISKNLEDPEEQGSTYTNVEQMRGQQEDEINSTLHEEIILAEEAEEITAPYFGRHSLEQADEIFTVEDITPMQPTNKRKRTPSSNEDPLGSKRARNNGNTTPTHRTIEPTNKRKRSSSSNEDPLGSKRARNNGNTTPTRRTLEVLTKVIEEYLAERDDAGVEDATTQTYPSVESVGVQASIQNDDVRPNENQRGMGSSGNSHSETNYEFFFDDGTVKEHFKFRRS